MVVARTRLMTRLFLAVLVALIGFCGWLARGTEAATVPAEHIPSPSSLIESVETATDIALLYSPMTMLSGEVEFTPCVLPAHSWIRPLGAQEGMLIVTIEAAESMLDMGCPLDSELYLAIDDITIVSPPRTPPRAACGGDPRHCA